MMTTRRTIKVDPEMFDRLIEEIKICDYPSELSVILSNEFNDTLIYEGGLIIMVSHWDNDSAQRCYVEFGINQLVSEQRDEMTLELVRLMEREVENIMQEALDDDVE